MKGPIVFISYSHDSEEHRQRVLGLSERLRMDGIETVLDQYVSGAPVAAVYGDISNFGVRKSDMSNIIRVSPATMSHAPLTTPATTRAPRARRACDHRLREHVVCCGAKSTHYHAERFHQGLGGQSIERPAGPEKEVGTKGKVVCLSRLGGMLSFHHREAA